MLTIIVLNVLKIIVKECFVQCTRPRIWDIELPRSQLLLSTLHNSLWRVVLDKGSKADLHILVYTQYNPTIYPSKLVDFFQILHIFIPFETFFSKLQVCILLEFTRCGSVVVGYWLSGWAAASGSLLGNWHRTSIHPSFVLRAIPHAVYLFSM